MARFTQYPAASTSDYADATTFLIANSDGEVKQASLEGLAENYFCNIKCDSVTITSAEMLALFTTPKEIIPAQGSGTIIVPLSVTAKMVNNTTPYATNVTFNIYTNGTAGALVSTDKFINTVLASPSYHQLELIQPTIISNSNIAENQPIEATVPLGNPTGGDGDVEIFVTYRVITV